MSDEIATLTSKIDSLTEQVNNLQTTIEKLVEMMDQRKDVLKKGKDTIDNIHNIFGNKLNMDSLFSMMVGSTEQDSDGSEGYTDPAQTPMLQIKDLEEDEVFNTGGTPFD
jgi:methyl-accepting chemotaxis protein